MSLVSSVTRGGVLGVFARPLRAPVALALPRSAVRAYSDKAEEKPADDKAAPADAEKSEGNDLEAQLKEKDARIKDLTDQLLYGKAELQNLQRRSAEEKKTAGEFGISKLAKDLTESIDVLDLALKSVPEELRAGETESKSPQRALVELYDGVSLTRKSILDMLRKHGIERFDPTGEPFDPTLHEAMYQVPVPGKEPGSVLDCSKVGYKIKGRLLRVAQVGVVQDTS
ncbi:GrpE, mitochondrial [Malassezia brasiliensis]|uniref:GrpE protein homolog n=1 Tax=Malassezia brasiliensis TaxID=1821822 RepID=A0AAF0IQ29_9BASI|nr:GrpE, mitochondrial [Malassezia brasiliensis]